MSKKSGYFKPAMAKIKQKVFLMVRAYLMIKKSIFNLFIKLFDNFHPTDRWIDRQSTYWWTDDKNRFTSFQWQNAIVWWTSNHPTDKESLIKVTNKETFIFVILSVSPTSCCMLWLVGWQHPLSSTTKRLRWLRWLCCTRWSWSRTDLVCDFCCRLPW